MKKDKNETIDISLLEGMSRKHLTWFMSSMLCIYTTWIVLLVLLPHVIVFLILEVEFMAFLVYSTIKTEQHLSLKEAPQGAPFLLFEHPFPGRYNFLQLRSWLNACLCLTALFSIIIVVFWFWLMLARVLETYGLFVFLSAFLGCLAPPFAFYHMGSKVVDFRNQWAEPLHQQEIALLESKIEVLKQSSPSDIELKRMMEACEKAREKQAREEKKW